MAKSRAWTVSNLMLGKAPDTNSPVHAYQSRQNKLIFSGSILPLLFWTGVVWFAADKNIVWGLIAAFSILYGKLHYVQAAGSDAVFDSLWERINLQSKWLDFRLQAIEALIKTGERRENLNGQQLWQDKMADDNQLPEAWHNYPERPEQKQTT